MNPIYFPFAVILLIGLTCRIVNSKSTGIPSDSINFSEIVPVPITEKDIKDDGPFPYDVFIAYRPSVSKHLARLLKVLLKDQGVTAFLDVDDFQDWMQHLDAVRGAPNFVLLLSNGALDGCIGDTSYADPLHQEIKQAIDNNRNIIPVFDDFTMPKTDFSPEINYVMRFQGLAWNHSMLNGTMQRIMKYLKV